VFGIAAASPGGNLTGTTTLTLEVGPKRLELLHEMVPTATMIEGTAEPVALPVSEAQSEPTPAPKPLRNRTA
jgi:putative ABC transport system substrate-binding protein